jgi:Tol biopolymer transport system component
VISEEQNERNRERSRRAEELFHSALKLAPDERSGFLRVACRDDEELLGEVESLLEHEKSADSFIGAPAFEVAAHQIASDERSNAGHDALPPGTVLSHFRVLEKLGRGGMGEVYRARDTRLGRTVAIKVLPEGQFAGEDARRRFQREARLLSGLSHPHICTIYDVGEEHGIHFIVMECLEGQTLAARLKRGRLPAAQVLQYAIEIADALEKAHRAGIVHRDLKPGNIMITKPGIKLLDFGLARVARPESAPLVSAISSLPTEDNDITGVGTIVGTLQYMAPEQLEGRTTDARTDIFAFGTVLYEMMTGRRAFQGTSHASLIAAILSSQPTPLLELSPVAPPALDRLIQKCLDKDPEERWQTAHDIRLQLQWIRDAGWQAAVPVVATEKHIYRKPVAWTVAAALLLIALATLGMLFWRGPGPPAPKIVFAAEPPFGSNVAEESAFAVAPDGLRLVYAVLDGRGKRSLWVRSLDSPLPVQLQGSESSSDYYGLAWTPDGRAVLATPDGKLVRLSVNGGAPELLCEKFDGLPSSINRNGTMLAWSAPPKQIFSIAPDDCTPRLRPPAYAADVGYAYPHFLPDGKHYLFAAVHKNKSREIMLGSLDDAAARVVIRNGSFPRYTAGHILFSRDGYLMAQKFDPSSLRAHGDSFLVHPNQLNFYAAFGWAAFDVSPNGLMSMSEQAEPPRVLRWYSRSGSILKTLTEPEHLGGVRLSHQGTSALVLVVNMRTHSGDLWTFDLESGSRRRETFHERLVTDWSAPSPGGDQVAYSVLTGRWGELYVKKFRAEGNGTPVQTGLQGSTLAQDISADGKWILFQLQPDGEDITLYAQSLAGGNPVLIARVIDASQARFSPDGRWVAFESNESGISEIIVKAFPPSSAQNTQMSYGGGHEPRWSADGKELFYRTNKGQVVAVPLLDLKERRIGKPETLFRLADGAAYDTMDGKGFLVTDPVGPAGSRILVIANWKPEPAKSP